MLNIPGIARLKMYNVDFLIKLATESEKLMVWPCNVPLARNHRAQVATVFTHCYKFMQKLQLEGIGYGQ